MSLTIGVCSLLATAAIGITLSVTHPWMLGDSNTFLKNFVTHELISVLGVIVTVTLASAANLHLALNRLEEAAYAAGAKNPGFPKTRQALKSTTSWLIGLLLAAFVVVVMKPIVVVNRPTEIASSVFNTVALLIVQFSVLMLIDITSMVFAVGPRTPTKPPSEPPKA
jgi:uncharacterized BrkB/YihY/UPF0761 family membrane protein